MSRPAAADRTLVIRNGTLIDGSGRPPVPNDALVVEGNRIQSVGRLPASVRLDGSGTDVEVIDAAGQWIMPGLIDAHTHLSYGYPVLRGEGRGRGTTRPELGVLKAASSAQTVLRSGVTSISVPGGTWFTDVGVRDAIKLGVMEGPRVHCAGRMIITYGSIEDDEPSWVGTPDHAVGVLCHSAAEMVAEVRRQCKHGVNFVKMADSRSGDVQTLAREEIAAVVDEAHRRGVRVAIHSRGSASTRAAADAGVDWIIHADLATEADLDAVARAGAALLPTMTFLATVVEAGGRGNNTFMPYGQLHAKELEILVTYCGFTPMEAIVAATRGNAFAVGLEGDVGLLESGKLADIIVMKRDPLADARALAGGHELACVIKDGRIVDHSDSTRESNPLAFR
jgi:imidazolonepropionase-like amidohydrolase